MCAGYGSDDQIKDNANLYEDVNMVLISLKALLMKLTGITDKVAEQTQVPTDNLGDDKVLSELGELIALDNDEENNPYSLQNGYGNLMKQSDTNINKLLENGCEYNSKIRKMEFNLGCFNSWYHNS